MPRQQVLAFGGVWQGLGVGGRRLERRHARDPPTGCARSAKALHRLPEDFTPHPRVAKLLDAARRARRAAARRSTGDCAELLAYGSLLLEGIPVRVSGQDTVRGTFSHRHAALCDAKDGRPWIPLNHLGDAGPGSSRRCSSPSTAC